MSNHQTHLDAAKQVCLTALHHLDHGLIVAVKQHSGSVVDDPSEPARIILTLELEALDLPVNHQRDDNIPALAGMALEEAKRRAMDELLGSGPKLGRGIRLATGEESGGESLHVVKDSEGEGRMVMGPLDVGVVKVAALTGESIIEALSRIQMPQTLEESIVTAILNAQDKAMRGDE